ncbi:MAG: tetratricopeptide repeat protein [Phycisphaerales bacterium]|nr:tetratricopeptide repeat protein [Phycisphaerales bacterium]
MTLRLLTLVVLLPLACNRTPTPAPTSASTSPSPPTPAEAVAPPRTLPEELQPIAMLIERGALPQARQAVEAFRAGNPASADGAFLEGLVYHRARRYAEAAPRFEDAIRLDPDYTLVQHFLGWARFHLGDLAGARTAFRTHLAADPHEPDSMFGLGLIAVEDGRLDDAEARFLDAIAIIEGLAESDPARHARRRIDLGKCHARLGDLAFARGDYEQARDLLERAVEQDPDQYTAYFTLSQVERRLGHVERADEWQRRHAEIMRAREAAKSP